MTETNNLASPMDRLVGQFNNAGCTWMELGRFHEAAKAFKESVDSMKLSVSGLDPETTAPIQAKKECSLREMNQNIKAVRSSLDSNPSKRQTIQKLLDADQSFLFRDCFHLPASERGESNLDWAASAHIVLYNMALANHLAAIELGNTSKLLNNSLKVYEMVYKLLQGNVTWNTRPMLMAVLNNTGHIHYSLLHYSDSTVCFDNLEMVVVNATSDVSLSTVVGDKNAKGVLHNLMFLKSSPTVAPAA